MKIAHHEDLTKQTFNNDLVKGVTGTILVGKDDGASHFYMRLFEIECDGHTPLHTHQWEHETFIHAGTGEVYKEGSWVPIKQGCAVFIPPGEKHQFRNTGSDKLQIICLVPSDAPEL
ncbi:MAG: cupin domain-containing protein [Bacteriovoracaceae bacterium]|nr:cupin domain-containing protein [Bacteriovoracaceae bacterium]